MTAPNLYTVTKAVGVLCIHCKNSGRRSALDKENLAASHGSTMQLRDLRFRCEGCKTRGTAIVEFELYLPEDFDEAKAFLAGEPLESCKIEV